MANVEMSDFAKKIKLFYDKGLYTYEQVKVFFKKGKITEEEFREITQSN